ncbi:hypothetical protein CAPTEDRAFT_154438 [Capitella teleta]|uniref:Cytochrome P450 n=1 Tax=Capitella teleta TaxID=283909 RepID=R7TB78_CAPTE|nr:hypothetical protein CAPTEDRAFT_154438 [Capitella teleta]|eukprot:ELT90964.1 hypothetical protein CAPTEDRAFT_154438 [Capitella teleta]
MWIPTILAGVLLVFGYALYRDRKNKHKVFEKMGIPGPVPHWWYGNLKQLNTNAQNSHEILKQWSQEYGSTFGYFEGPTPILVSSDLDLLKEIFIKNFNKFHGRKYVPVQPDPAEDKGCSMFMAQGQRWKRLRTITNPTFTAAKLKHSTELMNRKSRTLLKKLEAIATKGDKCRILPLLQDLTLDVIGESAFGIEVNAQEIAGNPLLSMLKRNREQNTLRKSFYATLPELRFTIYHCLAFFAKFVSVPRFQILESMGKVLEMRKIQPQRNPPDLMQLMIDAEATNHHGSLEIFADDDDDDDCAKASPDESIDIQISEADRERHAEELGKKKLTADEIKSQGFLFLLAGYETTSNTLACCSHALANNPDKQQLLYEEVNSIIQDDEELTYEKVKALPYLDMVLRETLRMYPIGSQVVTRRCVETCTINDLVVPRDMAIHANVWDVHYNANIWGATDPKIFEPERFLPDRKARRHPLAWLPFGAGPRNCIGLRFALLEAQIVLAKLIKKFRIVSCDQTKEPLEMTGGGGLLGPKDEVIVKLQLRSCEAET